jgi:hypothetical protein
MKAFLYRRHEFDRVLPLAVPCWYFIFLSNMKAIYINNRLKLTEARSSKFVSSLSCRILIFQICYNFGNHVQASALRKK